MCGGEQVGLHSRLLETAAGTVLEMCWETAGRSVLDKCCGQQVEVGYRYVGDSM